jgi:hypothetical protein
MSRFAYKSSEEVPSLRIAQPALLQEEAFAIAISYLSLAAPIFSDGFSLLRFSGGSSGKYPENFYKTHL